ncbi:hypothetical protein JXL21_08640 [Candidatus Bathyarchaeota archaeon]|nr:hypothetical protein [Candidatus Bathyarchaeota archaeon]
MKIAIDLDKTSRILLSSCFLLNLVSSVIRGIRPMLSMWLSGSYTQSPSYASILSAASLLISAAAVLTGFHVGRRGADESRHRDYAKAIIVGGALAPALLGLVYLVTVDDMMRAVIQIGFVNGLGGIIGFTGRMFTGLALAWFYRGDMLPKPSWVTSVVRLVALVQVWWVAAAVVRAALFGRVMAGIIRPAELGIYLAALSFVGYLVTLVYLYRLYGLGKSIDMRRRYADVLYSLLVPMVIRGVTVDLISLVNQEPTVQKIITSVAWEIIGSTIGVFGVGYTLISYAYLNKKRLTRPPHEI